MDLASAYPNSAISAGAMLVIALVMAGSLTLWLLLVFRADRQPTALSARQARQTPAAVAGPALAAPDPAGPALAGRDETAEDEQDKAGHGDAAGRRQAAA